MWDERPTERHVPLHHRDRKSTRLNSSHLVISYAVFCLKKKNTHVATLTALTSAAFIISIHPLRQLSYCYAHHTQHRLFFTFEMCCEHCVTTAAHVRVV